jgi:hypothetical protein
MSKRKRIKKEVISNRLGQISCAKATERSEYNLSWQIWGPILNQLITLHNTYFVYENISNVISSAISPLSHAAQLRFHALYSI